MMATPLIPQEIYLLERYSSLEHFGKMRDTWRTMLQYVEDLLNGYMRNLPPDYRSRPLSQQPDIVWGEHVLTNFRDTMQLLDSAFIKLSHGDYESLGRAVGVTGDIRGQTTDYWSGWMEEVKPSAEAKYYELLHQAGDYAWPIELTALGIWSPGDLTNRYDEVIKEPLNPPAIWPSYRLNRKVTVRSGGRVPQTGIYLPDADYGFPTLLIQSDDELLGEANEALVVIDPTYSEEREYRPVLWTLVERVSDQETAHAALSLIPPIRLRVEGGNPFPQTGYWFTPARVNSRRRFDEGEIMPMAGSDFGSTIWQWDPDQSA
jgi:hypothetical protein